MIVGKKELEEHWIDDESCDNDDDDESFEDDDDESCEDDDGESCDNDDESCDKSYHEEGIKPDGQFHSIRCCWANGGEEKTIAHPHKAWSGWY